MVHRERSQKSNPRVCSQHGGTAGAVRGTAAEMAALEARRGRQSPRARLEGSGHGSLRGGEPWGQREPAACHVESVSRAAEKALYNNNGWDLSRDGRKHVRSKGRTLHVGLGLEERAGQGVGRAPKGLAPRLCLHPPRAFSFLSQLTQVLHKISAPLVLRTPASRALVTMTSAPAPSGRDIRSEANPQLEPSCGCPVPRAQHPALPVPRRAGGQEQESWPASWARWSPRDGAQRRSGHGAACTGGWDTLESQVHGLTCRNGCRRLHVSQTRQKLWPGVSRSLGDHLPEGVGAGGWGELGHLGV